MRKIISGDEVLILTGKDRKKVGKVLKVIDDNFVVVSGLNLVKKHVKPNPTLGIQGGITEKESKIHISNVAILNPETKKADKVGFKVEDGKKVRIFKSTKNSIPSTKESK